VVFTTTVPAATVSTIVASITTGGGGAGAVAGLTVREVSATAVIGWHVSSRGVLGSRKTRVHVPLPCPSDTVTAILWQIRERGGVLSSGCVYQPKTS
jgi:hypothetical protein